ncbi:MAG: flagellar filament capping protein FliD [bacterium]|nr:flagellar filament capping protein FliD [bacterium]
MALTLDRINPATVLAGATPSTSTSSSAFVGGSSVAGAFADQFVKQQASLIYTRYSASDRVFIHQGIGDRAQALERAARNLFSRNGDSIFDEREVVISTSSAVSGTADRLTSPFTFGIEVSQLAQAQEVVSDDLSDADDDFSDGTESFSLTVEGTTFSMSIDVGASDTNIDVLDALADEFNDQASSGVYAEVVSDSDTGESYLALTAHSTGTDSAFTLSGSILSGINLDESVSVDSDAGTGGLVVTAQNATYTIDADSSTTSQSNTISLYDDSVELTLAATTDDEAVTVEVQANTSEIEEDLTTFVNAYNDALGFALSLPSEATTSYALELNAAVSPFVSSLEAIGVERSSTGRLSIDSSKLSEALGDDRFARASASFIGSAGLATVTERASRNLLDAGNAFLTHPTNRVETDALLTVNRYQNLGMIIDLIA